MKIHHHRARLSGCSLNDHSHHLHHHHQRHQHRHHHHHRHLHHDQRQQHQQKALHPIKRSVILSIDRRRRRITSPSTATSIASVVCRPVLINTGRSEPSSKKQHSGRRSNSICICRHIPTLSSCSPRIAARAEER